jgi:hypothetical protein
VASTLLDLVAMTVSSAFGTSTTIPLGTAATINGVTYLSFANAGATGGTQVTYSILDTGNSETGTAIYTSSNTTLTNRTPTRSTNGSTFINASSAALIQATARAQDIVTAVTAGNGLTGGSSGGAISLAVSLTTLTNSLTSDIALSSAGTYFDGPTVAQGTSGTWYASGSVLVTDVTGGGAFFFKLWDGTTVFDSGGVNTNGANARAMIPVSGRISNPAGNIRISVANVSGSTNSAMRFNNSGNPNDSTITVLRIG